PDGAAGPVLYLGPRRHRPVPLPGLSARETELRGRRHHLLRIQPPVPRRALRRRGWHRREGVRQLPRARPRRVPLSTGRSAGPDGPPNGLREAMSVGTPVVASRVAGIPEALDDGRCGVLVPPADVAALADAIAGVLADEDRRRQFAARGRRRTEELFDAWRNGS